MDPKLVGAAIPAERLYDCVNVVRSLWYPCWPVCSLGAHPSRDADGPKGLCLSASLPPWQCKAWRRQRCSRRVQSMLRPAQRPQHGWSSPSLPCIFLATPQIFHGTRTVPQPVRQAVQPIPALCFLFPRNSVSSSPANVCLLHQQILSYQNCASASASSSNPALTALCFALCTCRSCPTRTGTAGGPPTRTSGPSKLWRCGTLFRFRMPCFVRQFWMRLP